MKLEVPYFAGAPAGSFERLVTGYPFNAKDYLALINPKGGEKKPVKPGVRKPAAKKKP